MTVQLSSAQPSFQPGDVVTLKSGGQAITVVGVTEQGVQCVWIGEEGDLFSATLPAAALLMIDDGSDAFADDEDISREDTDEESHHDTSHDDEKAA